MKDLTQEDLDFALSLVDTIVDKTDEYDVYDTLIDSLESYEGDRRRQMLTHLNTLFLNVQVNELSFRGDDAYNVAQAARISTKQINNREDPRDKLEFNGDLDSVYRILKKFVRDEVVGADFSESHSDPLGNLKDWWKKKKHLFKK